MDKRKELKAAYKQNIPAMGVYQVQNTVNGKILIGSSMNLGGRENSYRAQLDFYRHHHKALQTDLDECGMEAFVFSILETIDSEKVEKEAWKDAVSALEEKWLAKLTPYGERGYNKEKPPKKETY